MSVEQVRLSVRRKKIWDDLKKAARKRIGPTSNLKIVFLGEPAIDDGGPKREFFSGVGYVQYYFQMSKAKGIEVSVYRHPPASVFDTRVKFSLFYFFFIISFFIGKKYFR